MTENNKIPKNKFWTELQCIFCNKKYLKHKRLKNKSKYCSRICYLKNSSNWIKRKQTEYQKMVASLTHTGRQDSLETKERKRLSKLRENNPNWQGDEQEVHNWIRRRKLKPKFCECCNIVPPYDLANISQEYKRDVNDFEWLCRSCHMKKDGMLEKFILSPRLKKNNYEKHNN